MLCKEERKVQGAQTEPCYFCTTIIGLHYISVHYCRSFVWTSCFVLTYKCHWVSVCNMYLKFIFICLYFPLIYLLFVFISLYLLRWSVWSCDLSTSHLICIVHYLTSHTHIRFAYQWSGMEPLVERFLPSSSSNIYSLTEYMCVYERSRQRTQTKC